MTDRTNMIFDFNSTIELILRMRGSRVMLYAIVVGIKYSEQPIGYGICAPGGTYGVFVN